MPRPSATRYAVFSDPHGNIEALNAVLADMAAQEAEPLACLGDAIGYGPEPEAVVREIRSRGIPMVMGNHEMAVANDTLMQRLNPQARAALEVTRGLLGPETMGWLAGLPHSLVLHGCRMVHGAPPDRVNTYLFFIRDAGLHALFRQFQEDVCFVGHTHELVLVSFDGERAVRSTPQTDTWKLEPGLRFIVNVGSVGQPRDGDNRAKYVIWEPASRTVTVRRVSYDIEATVRGIAMRGLPKVYGDRLR